MQTYDIPQPNRTECRSRNCGMQYWRMSALGVRRAKAALSSGCKSHPATAAAGSNRSSHGGDEMGRAKAARQGFAIRQTKTARRRSVERGVALAISAGQSADT